MRFLNQVAHLIRALKHRSPGEQGDCYRGTVAQRRFVQHECESGSRQNPDSFGKLLLPESEQQLALQEDLEGLRAWSFYHLLLARTRHYDRVYQDAVKQGVKQIVLFGAGWDTRAYRFADLLREHDVSVLETDLALPIQEKEARVRALGDFDHVRFMALDLNTVDFERWFEESGLDPRQQTLLLAEGVTEYLEVQTVQRWLSFVGQRFKSSIVAYDGCSRSRSEALALFLSKRGLYTVSQSKRACERFHRGFGLRTLAAHDSPELVSLHVDYSVPSTTNLSIYLVLAHPG